MAKKWEYATLHYTTDPGDAKGVRRAWVTRPGKGQQEVPPGESTADDLARFGGDGWELVGPPTVFNSVFTYKAANGTHHDRAYWVAQTFYFKRPG